MCDSKEVLHRLRHGWKYVEKHKKHNWFWICATVGPLTCAGQLCGASFPSWPRRSAVALSASLVRQEFQSPAACLSQLALELTPIPPFPVSSRAAAGEGKLLRQPHLSLRSSHGHLPNTAPSWSWLSYNSLKKANTVIFLKCSRLCDVGAMEHCGEVAGDQMQAELCHLGARRKPGRGFICRREMQKRDLQKRGLPKVQKIQVDLIEETGTGDVKRCMPLLARCG